MNELSTVKNLIERIFAADEKINARELSEAQSDARYNAVMSAASIHTDMQRDPELVKFCAFFGITIADVITELNGHLATVAALA